MVTVLIEGPDRKQLSVPQVQENNATINRWEDIATENFTLSTYFLSLKLAEPNYCQFDLLSDFNQIVFDEFAKQWQQESDSMSSITQMTNLRSYQFISSMGKNALPLILRKMQEEMPEPDMWFKALENIAVTIGLKPPAIPDEAIADNKLIAEKWFEWAGKNAISW